MTNYLKIEQMINKNNAEFNLREYNEKLYYFIFDTLLKLDKMFYLDSFKISTLPFPDSDVIGKIYIREYQFGFNIFAIEHGMNYSGLKVVDFLDDIIVKIEREHMKKIRKDYYDYK